MEYIKERNENERLEEKQRAEETKIKLIALIEEYKNYLKKITMAQFKNEWIEFDNDLNKIENEILTISQVISNLKKEKEGLGLFSGKRKKEIDKEISEYNIQLHSLTNKKEELKQKRKGYNSISEIDNELYDIEKELMKLNDKFEMVSNTRTSEEILKEVEQYSSTEFVSVLKKYTDKKNGEEIYKKNGEEICKEILNILSNVSSIRNAKKGDYVRFGKYFQKNDVEEKQEIEWLVLDVKGKNALLISRYGLDSKPYNAQREDTTWEKCSLRSWLNSDFISEAFTIGERNYICKTTVTADKNPAYITNPGNDTQDKIFLLSINEVEKYFPSDNGRQCVPTEYLKNKGAYTNNVGCRCWWLRSPGYNQYNAALVNISGDVAGLGLYVDLNYAVRPALWINLES